MSYTVTLNHVRYGKVKFDLADLKRRIEAAIAAGSTASRLGRVLVRTIRLMAVIDAVDSGRNPRDLKAALDAELALFLLDFEHVQAVIAGTGAPRRKRRLARALPAPKKKLPRP